VVEGMNVLNQKELISYEKLFDFTNVKDFKIKTLNLEKDRFQALYLFTLTDAVGVEHPIYVGMSSRFYDRIRDYARPHQIQAINDIKIQTEIRWLQEHAKHFSVYYWQVDVETRKQLHALENKEIKLIDPYFNRKEVITKDEEAQCKKIDAQIVCGKTTSKIAS